MRRQEAGDTGLQLRGEEDEVMAGLSQGPPSTGWTFLHQPSPSFICLPAAAELNLQEFYSLCRGERLGRSCVPARAQCILTSYQQPYLLLAPVR